MIARRRHLSNKSFMRVVGRNDACVTTIVLLLMVHCSSFQNSLSMIVEAFTPPHSTTTTTTTTTITTRKRISTLHGQGCWQGTTTTHHYRHRQIMSSSPFSCPNNHNRRDNSAASYSSSRYRRGSSSSTSLMMLGGGGILSRGITTFASNWKAYSLIPLIAGFVGWFTNYLAVQMIFYPIKWWGIPIYRVEGEPLGLLGWQGELKTTNFVLCFIFAFLFLPCSRILMLS
jgi:hypothetical protein